MNKSMIAGEWNEIKGKIQRQWSKLTDDDLGVIKGNIEELAGRVQKVYGYTKEKAMEEFHEFKKTLADGKADAKSDAREAMRETKSDIKSAAPSTKGTY